MHDNNINEFDYNYFCRTVGKFLGCLNFVNFGVELKSQNLTALTPIYNWFDATK